jgi:hypothetical protein
MNQERSRDAKPVRRSPKGSARAAGIAGLRCSTPVDGSNRAREENPQMGVVGGSSVCILCIGGSKKRGTTDAHRCTRIKNRKLDEMTPRAGTRMNRLDPQGPCGCTEGRPIDNGLLSPAFIAVHRCSSLAEYSFQIVVFPPTGPDRAFPIRSKINNESQFRLQTKSVLAGCGGMKKIIGQRWTAMNSDKEKADVGSWREEYSIGNVAMSEVGYA